MLNLNSNVFITLYWTFFHFSTGRGENVTQSREQETESQNPETIVWKEQGFVIPFVALCCLTYCEIGKSKLSLSEGRNLWKWTSFEVHTRPAPMSPYSQGCAAYMSSVEKSVGLELNFPLAEQHWESFFFLSFFPELNTTSLRTPTQQQFYKGWMAKLVCGERLLW